MEYIGRVKTGQLRPKPEQKLAIIRLPVELKDLAGLYCHIWKIDDRTFVMQFSEKREAEHPTIQFGDQQTEEDRLSKLEKQVEELKQLVLDKTSANGRTTQKNACPEPDLNRRPCGLQPHALPG